MRIDRLLFLDSVGGGARPLIDPVFLGPPRAHSPFPSLPFPSLLFPSLPFLLFSLAAKPFAALRRFHSM